MDVGPAKTRQRYTAGIRPLTIYFDMSESQVEVLDEFYNDTLAGGSLRFRMNHPRTAVSHSMRMTAEPEYTPAKAEKDGEYAYFVKLEVEVLPS